jgi:integrase
VLAAYHGARLEEFADLYARDFGCDNGTWFIRIQESEDRRLKKRRRDGRMVEGRRLKNSNASRVLPIHPELIHLGFPAYVSATAPKPDMPLFPDIEPQGMDGKRGPRVTRWFVEYRKAIGVFRPGVGMHAFRHAANTRLRDAMRNRQDERIINYILGHSGGGGEGDYRYDKGPGLKAAAEVLALLRYPEIDLSHLYAAP